MDKKIIVDCVGFFIRIALVPLLRESEGEEHQYGIPFRDDRILRKSKGQPQEQSPEQVDFAKDKDSADPKDFAEAQRDQAETREGKGSDCWMFAGKG